MCTTGVLSSNAGLEILGERAWFALRVKSNFEKPVARFLRDRGYEEFLPLCRERRRIWNQEREMECPLFSGYLFGRFDAHRWLPILQIPGVVHVVGIHRVPLPVDPAEIAALQSFVRSGLVLEHCPFLQVGDRVRIERGPLAGAEGILLDFKSQHRLVTSITLLQRSVSVEIQRDWVVPLRPGVRTEFRTAGREEWGRASVHIA